MIGCARRWCVVRVSASARSTSTTQVVLEDQDVDRALLAKLLPSQWRVFAARHPMHAVRTRRVGALLAEQQAQYFRRPFI